MRDMWTRSHEILMVLRAHPQFQRVEKFLTFEQFLLHLGGTTSTLTHGAVPVNNRET